jgi:hypothetical protein
MNNHPSDRDNRDRVLGLTRQSVITEDVSPEDGKGHRVGNPRGDNPLFKPTVKERPEVRGIKFDGDKPDYSLMPAASMDEMVKVLSMGAKKYDRENWRKLENGEDRYFAAAMRHLWAIRMGEEIDSESGLPHAAHAAVNCVLLNEIIRKK